MADDCSADPKTSVADISAASMGEVGHRPLARFGFWLGLCVIVLICMWLGFLQRGREYDAPTKVEMKWRRLAHHRLRYRRLARLWSNLGRFLHESNKRGVEGSVRLMGGLVHGLWPGCVA